MAKGKLITLEGIDGSGKTTAVAFIKDHLESKGIEVITTAPFSTLSGKYVRHAITSGTSPEAETLLFLAELVQLANETILPALNNGKWVICDRYIDSTYAYQGHAKNVHPHVIEEIASSFLYNNWPDLTLYFNVSIKEAQERLTGRPHLDAFETSGPEFYKLVQRGYKEIEELNPERFKTINADQSLTKVWQEIRQTLDENLQYP